ncbi:uncharacterized protein [Antedon mediterranea]|uniref:uncharacterized protein n=1 Tax=Antedon mediterranea TaxID=105859 RepID=UPI003AF5B889
MSNHQETRMWNNLDGTRPSTSREWIFVSSPIDDSPVAADEHGEDPSNDAADPSIDTDNPVNPAVVVDQANANGEDDVDCANDAVDDQQEQPIASNPSNDAADQVVEVENTAVESTATDDLTSVEASNRLHVTTSKLTPTQSDTTLLPDNMKSLEAVQTPSIKRILSAPSILMTT